MSKTRASCFIRGSRHLETKICFSKSVSRCLEPLMKHWHSFLTYYVNSSCAQAPPGWPPGINIFWPWIANSRGWGLLSCQIPRGGNEKWIRANVLFSVNTATFFIDRTAVELCRFKHFNVRFFVSINVFLCNDASILIIKINRAL